MLLTANPASARAVSPKRSRDARPLPDCLGRVGTIVGGTGHTGVLAVDTDLEAPGRRRRPSLRLATADLSALLDPRELDPDLRCRACSFLALRSRRSFSASCVRAPTLLLVLDDIHATDMATLMLLQFVARGLRGSRVLLLAAARDTSFATTPEAGALLAQVAREARHVPLQRLERDDLRSGSRTPLRDSKPIACGPPPKAIRSS